MSSGLPCRSMWSAPSKPAIQNDAKGGAPGLDAGVRCADKVIGVIGVIRVIGSGLLASPPFDDGAQRGAPLCVLQHTGRSQ